MLGTAWLTLRQAQAALKNGRLEEAQRLLHQSGTQGHRRSHDLLQQVGQGYVERGVRRLAQNDAEAAWIDLLRAEQVGLTESAAPLRQNLTRQAVSEVQARLEAADPARAAETAALLRERLVRQPELQTLEEVARDWLEAQKLADRGEFAAALQMVERLRHNGREISSLERFSQELQRRQTACSANLVQLQEAVAAGHWREVIARADQVLATAPQHVEARHLRARAWQAIRALDRE
jgi:hypothetical protein